MLRTIVEGEPGIFPDPVARIMRGIGGIFRRRGPADEAPVPAPGTPPEGPGAADAGADVDADAGAEPDQPTDHSGETR